MITDLNSLYFSDVTYKLDLALNLYRKYQAGFDSDRWIRQELNRLDDLIDALQQKMASLAMFSICTECGRKSGGGCCSAFMAGETDSILILINLLLGVDVDFQQDNGPECVYLGDNGCIFKAKPMFCLNYNCSAIYEINPGTEIAEMEEAAGNVLRQQYKVEQHLLRYLV
ncbi:MAG: hypothetical protein ACLFV2_01560 [Desulfurivibrionaceae bacterium]